MRIPGLIDVLRVRDAGVIRSVADDVRLDRVTPGRGPLLNRLVVRMARDMLKVFGHSLPSGRGHSDHQRRTLRRVLLDRLADPALEAALTDPVAQAADYVQGGKGDPMHLAQALLGPVLIDGFVPTPPTVEAAKTMGLVLNAGLVRQLADWVFGGSARAREVLYKACDGDLNAVHAIGIASQNLAASLVALRALPRDMPGDQAMALAMSAPRQVLRQGKVPAETLGGSVRPGTLVVLQVSEAAQRGLDPDTAFLRHAWSGCPAHDFIPSLLARIWRDAGDAS